MKMNALKLGLFSAIVVLSMLMVSTSFAATKCADMKIAKIGTKTIGGLQVNTMAASLASGTCGTMTVGTATRTFYIGDAIGDAGLATALTAMSLGQNVTIFVTDPDAINGTTAESILVLAP